MHNHDRERLATGIVLAVLMHAVLGAVFWIAGWAQIEPYPEYIPPLYVDLESSFIPDEEPPAEEIPDEESEELVMEDPGEAQDPEPQPEPPAQPEPEQEAEPQAEPPAQQEPEPRPPAQPDPEPRQQPPAQPEPQPQPEPEPQQTYDFEGDLSTLYGRDEPDDSPAPAPDDGLFDINDTDTAAEDPNLPEWVNDSGISVSDMAPEEIVQLDDRIKRDPAIEALMQRANQAVERGRVPTVSETERDGPTPATDGPATESLGDNASIQWAGQSGGRGSGGDLPTITASDFDGPIPRRITFVVLFDVDSQGHVLPGSVILQRRSGSTEVDRKVQNAVSSWNFLPKPGAGVETGVFTLVVESRDLR